MKIVVNADFGGYGYNVSEQYEDLVDRYGNDRTNPELVAFVENHPDDCGDLAIMTIPDNATNMYRTFDGCTKFKNKNINILSPNVSNMQDMIINCHQYNYSDYGGLRIYVPKDSLTNNTAHNTLNFNSVWTYNNSNNCYYHDNLFVYYI